MNEEEQRTGLRMDTTIRLDVVFAAIGAAVTIVASAWAFSSGTLERVTRLEVKMEERERALNTTLQGIQSRLDRMDSRLDRIDLHITSGMPPTSPSGARR